MDSEGKIFLESSIHVKGVNTPKHNSTTTKRYCSSVHKKKKQFTLYNQNKDSSQIVAISGKPACFTRSDSPR